LTIHGFPQSCQELQTQQKDALKETAVPQSLYLYYDLNKSGAWKGGLNFNPYYDYSYDGTMRCVEQSMHRLGISKIDILHIHDVDYFTHKEKHLVEKYN